MFREEYRWNCDEETATVRLALIYRGQDGNWISECRSLPGCVSQGRTREEAIQNIREAIELYFEALEADQLPAPEEPFDTFLVVV